MRIRWRWSLTIETGRAPNPAAQPVRGARPTLEATDGGAFELDGQTDSGELQTHRIKQDNPTGFGFSKRAPTITDS